MSCNDNSRLLQDVSAKLEVEESVEIDSTLEQ